MLSFASQLTAADSGDGSHSAEDVAPAAFLYFASSAAVIAACILGYSALPLLPYGRCDTLLPEGDAIPFYFPCGRCERVTGHQGYGRIFLVMSSLLPFLLIAA